MIRKFSIGLLATTLLTLAACSKPEAPATSEAQVQEAAPTVAEQRFTIAAIPDTQNYLDFTHQKAHGFVLDAADQFLGQMQYIADNTVARGGDIVFVTHLGDVWQHQTIEMDEEHKAAGFKAIPNKWFGSKFKPLPEQVTGIEMPMAVEGFRIIAETGVPFGVVPGNHDFDAMWSAEGWTPVEDRKDIRMTPETLGMIHAGGLDNFRSVFGSDSEFYKDKPWYVASFDGGSSSAQIFTAGGYTFLHLSLDMSPTDEVLAWARDVLAANPGLPTIVTTHDYLNHKGERLPNPIVDFHAVDPRHNNAQMLWDKFISQNDQIFMVLSGHQRGQALNIDMNNRDNRVYQILADYQDRGQSVIEAGGKPSSFTGMPVGLGDGWFRLMTFDFSGEIPVLEVKTYSSHYKANATDVADYAAWYKKHEQPGMSDTEFVEADNFSVELLDFRERFDKTR